MAMEKVADLLVDAGMSRSDATMTIDIAKHAMDEAVDRIAKICALAPNEQIAQAAYLAALRGLEVNIGMAMKEGRIQNGGR